MSVFRGLCVIAFLLVLGACNSGGDSGGGSSSSTTTTVGTHAVTLNWTAAATGSATVGYKIEKSTDAVSYAEVLSVDNVTTASVTSLAAGTYYFRIRAYNAGGYSSYTSPVSITIAN